MGKHSLYHPLSLNVLRGAAEYSGWKIGRITQVSADQSRSTARYCLTIERMPRGASEWPIGTIRKQFQHCFMDDITVSAVWISPHGQWYSDIVVTLDGQLGQNGDLA